MSLSLLPSNALVGLITFGTMVMLLWGCLDSTRLTSSAGASARARLHRVREILRFPGKQGLHSKTSAGNAWSVNIRHTQQCPSAAWETSTCRGPSRKISASCTTVRIPTHKRFGAASERPLARSQRQTLLEMYWRYLERCGRLTRDFVPKRRWEDHVVRWRTRNRRTRPCSRS